MIEVYQYLRQYQIKPSVQRTAVMDFLLKNRIHPTIDDIYLALSPDMPTLSKTTVYNTLDLFVSKGAVRPLVIDEKNARYDVDLSNHAHFICRECGGVQDIFNVNPKFFDPPVLCPHQIEMVEISYFGLCNHCSSN